MIRTTMELARRRVRAKRALRRMVRERKPDLAHWARVVYRILMFNGLTASDAGAQVGSIVFPGGTP